MNEANNYQSTSTVINAPGYCGSRLPCGVCLLLGTQCPLGPTTITPTWGTVNVPYTTAGGTQCKMK